jgi:Zn finger protein HypA/HybF involved in hydrogenase expression
MFWWGKGDAVELLAYANVTLADLALLVIEVIEASCLCCGASWLSPYDFLPPSTRLPAMAGLLICPACGGRELRVAPATRLAERAAH